MKLQRGQNLFRALRDVCDFIALESDMDEIVKSVEADNANKIYVFDCWDLSGALTTINIKATCEEHAILKFEKQHGNDYGYDNPYVG